MKHLDGQATKIQRSASGGTTIFWVEVQIFSLGTGTQQGVLRLPAAAYVRRDHTWDTSPAPPSLQSDRTVHIRRGNSKDEGTIRGTEKHRKSLQSRPLASN